MKTVMKFYRDRDLGYKRKLNKKEDIQKIEIKIEIKKKKNKRKKIINFNNL